METTNTVAFTSGRIPVIDETIGKVKIPAPIDIMLTMAK